MAGHRKGRVECGRETVVSKCRVCRARNDKRENTTGKCWQCGEALEFKCHAKAMWPTGRCKLHSGEHSPRSGSLLGGRSLSPEHFQHFQNCITENDPEKMARNLAAFHYAKVVELSEAGAPDAAQVEAARRAVLATKAWSDVRQQERGDESGGPAAIELRAGEGSEITIAYYPVEPDRARGTGGLGAQAGEEAGAGGDPPTGTPGAARGPEGPVVT